MKKSIAIIFIISSFVLVFFSGCSTGPATQPANTQAPEVTSLPPTLASTPTSLPTSSPVPPVPLNSLTDQAGVMCDKAFKSSVKNQTASAPLLTLVKNNFNSDTSQWRYNPSKEQIHPLTEAKLVDQVQTLVCVQENRTSAGAYDDGTGAFIINWKVRLVRWADGQVVGEKNFTGGKPPQRKVHGGDGYGFSPYKEYREWLLNLFAGESVFVQGVGVSGVAFSMDGKYLVVVGNDYSAKIWDIALHKAVFTQAGKSNILSAFIPVVFSPNQHHLALGYLGGLNLLSVEDWKSTADIKGMDDLWNVTFSSDGSQMAAGLGWGNGGVKIIDPATGTETKRYPMKSPVSQVIISSGDQYLIGKVHSCATCATTPETGIFVWDFNSGVQLNNIKIPGVLAMALLKDGKTLAVAVADKKDILLVDLLSGKQVGSMMGHVDLVNLLAISSDGKWLASADKKGTIHVWDLDTLQIWQTSEGNGLISSLAFSTDGNALAVGSSDGTVELWKLQ